MRLLAGAMAASEMEERALRRAGSGRPRGGWDWCSVVLLVSKRGVSGSSSTASIAKSRGETAEVVCGSENARLDRLLEVSGSDDDSRLLVGREW